MTNIRKHGFDNDRQWREHLAEIEEPPIVAKTSNAWLNPAISEELATLRQEVAALRQRVEAPTWHQRAERPTLLIAAVSVLVALITTLHLGKFTGFR